MYQEKDKAYQDTISFGTCCSQCHRNTFVGSYPFWHKFARRLCEKCQLDYKKLLISLEAYDKDLFL